MGALWKGELPCLPFSVFSFWNCQNKLIKNENFTKQNQRQKIIYDKWNKYKFTLYFIPKKMKFNLLWKTTPELNLRWLSNCEENRNIISLNPVWQVFVPLPWSIYIYISRWPEFWPGNNHVYIAIAYKIRLLNIKMFYIFCSFSAQSLGIGVDTHGYKG